MGGDSSFGHPRLTGWERRRLRSDTGSMVKAGSRLAIHSQPFRGQLPKWSTRSAFRYSIAVRTEWSRHATAARSSSAVLPLSTRLLRPYGSLALASLDHACRDHRPGFSATLTTTAFSRSSLRWLEFSS